MKLFVFLLSLSIISLYSCKDIKPKFNLKSGFYNTNSITLEINIEDPQAIIYYTLDGSTPTVYSEIYNHPLILEDRSFEQNVYSAITKVSPDNDYIPHEKIKKANIIRSMAKLSNGTLTPVISGTYFVGFNRTKLYPNVPIISIITDPANLFDYEKGIYVMGKMYDEWIKEDPNNKNVKSYNKIGNYNMKGKQSERLASIEYFPIDENEEGFKEEAGIRIMGSATRSALQKSFRVVFRKDYGKKNLKYELIPGNNRSDGQGIVNKYKSFNIRNGGNDCQNTKIRDQLLQDLISNRKLETQQSELGVLFLDGEYWGVYTIMENYDKNYIANNYDIEDDNVVIIKKYKIEEGNESDLDLFNQDINFIINEDMSNPSIFNKVCEFIDINNLAWFFAFNIYIGNRDGIFQDNNWSMWRVKNPIEKILNADGKWRVLIYDNELSSGLFINGIDYGEVFLPSIFNETSKISKTLGTKLLNSLLKNEEFKNIFINALSDIRNIDFEENRVIKYIEKLNDIIEPLMHDNFVRFGPDSVLDDSSNYFKKEIGILKKWFYDRYSIFINNIGKSFGFKPAVEVSITSNDFLKGSFSVNNGWKVFEEEFKGLYFNENILYLSAVPSKGKFLYWRVKNCKLSGDNDEIYFQTTSPYLGINPLEGCTVEAFYK